MTAFEPNGIGESRVATDGKTISVTLDTADSGLMTLNLPLSLSGHLIRILTARTREAHERLQKAGEKTEDGVVTAYQVPTNILQRLAIGLTKLFSDAAARQSRPG